MQILESDRALPPGTLLLPNTADVVAHAMAVADAPAIVLDFPKWTDGRAYSQAVVLRGRLRYAGALHARGEVVIDMLPLLARCGFDVVQLADGENRAAAQRVLDELPGPFPGPYQRDPARGQAAALAGAGAGA
jgi:uncharacterized protein (DUF934 family)